MKSELVKRIVSGVILASAVLYITLWDPRSFALMCALGGFILWKEWRRLTRTRGPGWIIGGLIYFGAALGSLVAIRFRVDGTFLIFLIFLLVWSGDIGGYIVGKLMGRHKIAPTISPGKSWEGLAGSILLTAGGMYAVSTLSAVQWPWWVFLLIGVIVSGVGLAGDLFESWLKRRAGVKDSGTLIPGHGGLFDRVDALLPVAILFGILYLLAPYLASRTS